MYVSCDCINFLIELLIKPILLFDVCVFGNVYWIVARESMDFCVDFACMEGRNVMVFPWLSLTPPVWLNDKCNQFAYHTQKS